MCFADNIHINVLRFQISLKRHRCSYAILCFRQATMFVNKQFGTANPVDLEVDVLLIVLMSRMLIQLLRSTFRPSALTKRRPCILG